MIPRFRYGIILLLLALALGLAGCLSLEPQVIIQTRLVGTPRTAGLPVTTAPTPFARASATPNISPTALATLPLATPVPTNTSAPMVRICFAPDSQQLRRMVLYEQFADLLRAGTGMNIEIIVPDSYQAAIAVLCAGQVDVAWLATPAYIVARDACGAQARFSVLRGGAATHRAQVITLSDAARKARNLPPINSFFDLDGKSFGFTDPLSTTGYLFPKAMLLERGIRPGQELFLGGDPQVVLAVYKGELDAGATYWAAPHEDGSIGDGRAELLADYSDIGQQLKIIQLSQAIPNDPIVFRADLAPPVRDGLLAAFVGLAASREGRQLLDSLYSIGGLALVSDDDYDGVRAMGKTLKLDFNQLVEGRYMPSR